MIKSEYYDINAISLLSDHGNFYRGPFFAQERISRLAAEAAIRRLTDEGA